VNNFPIGAQDRKNPAGLCSELPWITNDSQAAGPFHNYWWLTFPDFGAYSSAVEYLISSNSD
jgi:hypothetical protein